MAQQFPMYDKKDQFQKIESSLLQGEKVYAVYEVVANSHGLQFEIPSSGRKEEDIAPIAREVMKDIQRAVDAGKTQIASHNASLNDRVVTLVVSRAKRVIAEKTYHSKLSRLVLDDDA